MTLREFRSILLHTASRAFIYLMYAWVAFSVVACGLTLAELATKTGRSPEEMRSENIPE